MIMIMFMIVMSLMGTKSYAKRHVEKSWFSTVQTVQRENWRYCPCNTTFKILSTDVLQRTLTLKMTTTVVYSKRQFNTVNNLPIQDYTHPDDHIPPIYEMTHRFNPWHHVNNDNLTHYQGKFQVNH